ncbi:prokineticin-2 isoform 2-T2 [Dama dama]
MKPGLRDIRLTARPCRKRNRRGQCCCFRGGKTEVQARLSATKGKPRHSMTALSTLASWKHQKNTAHLVCMCEYEEGEMKGQK